MKKSERGLPVRKPAALTSYAGKMPSLLKNSDMSLNVVRASAALVEKCGADVSSAQATFGPSSLAGDSLTKKIVKAKIYVMLDVEVIEDAVAAAVALDPVRSRLLSELSKPASAAALASRLGIARQKLNYHLRELEAQGLVRVAEERKWGGLTERLLIATAASYVVSPNAMGRVAIDPERCADRLSAGYLIALAGRIVREVSMLIRRSSENEKRLATLSIDTEIRFRSPADRAEFTNELTQTITKLAARYHDETAPGGRPHRLVIVAHPLPQDSKSKEERHEC